MLREHQSATEGIDALTLRWDGGDIPYPFPDNSFDEFHCHMVTSPIIGRSVEPRVRLRPTPEIFADEVNRLLRPQGRIYLTTDIGGHIFEAEGCLLSERTYSMMKPADRLIQSLRSHGFSLNELNACRGSQERLEGKDYGVEIKEVDFVPIIPFTDVHMLAGVYCNPALILIATKAPHPVK